MRIIGIKGIIHIPFILKCAIIFHAFLNTDMILV